MRALAPRYDALHDEPNQDDDLDPRPSPGKVSLTARLAPRRAALYRKAEAAAAAAAPRSRTTAVAASDDPFGVHLLAPAASAPSATVFRKASDGASADPSAELSSLPDGGGMALPHHVRELVESTTGATLGDVTVHAGPEAEDAASSVGATAFAVENRIYLGRGASIADTQLMVHEAVHTLQGGSAGGVSSPGDACELEADRVADAAMTGGHAPIAAAGGSSQIRRKADPGVVGKIQGFDGIIQEVATRLRVPPGLVKGIIAAESGGKPDLVAKSGYTGLMQAKRDEGQKDPKTSIETGVALFKSKAKAVGVTEADFGTPEKIALVMVAYNAGEGTVKKAMQYAREAGDVERWYDPEHFRRAVIHYGAHNPATAIQSELRQMDGDALASAVKLLERSAAAQGETPEVAHAVQAGQEGPGEGPGADGSAADDPIRKKYFGKKGWNVAGLRAAIVKAVEKERKALRFQNLTLADVQARATRWQMLSVEWKHVKGRPYVTKVLEYKAAFENGTISKVTFEESEVEPVIGDAPAQPAAGGPAPK